MSRKYFNQFTGYKYTKKELLSYAKLCNGRKSFKYKRCAINLNCLDECYSIIDNNKKEIRKLNIQNIKDEIRKEAINYKSRSLFRKEHPKLYYYDNIYKFGILDELLPTQKYSTQQQICKIILENIFEESCIYNDRKTLNGKELDIYFPNYKVAFEYNSFYWHENRKNDDLTKKVLCDELGIKLFIIEEPSANAYINFDNAVQSIKEQIINFIPSLCETLNKKISEKHIRDFEIDKGSLFCDNFNLKDIEYLINNCNRYSEVKNKYNRIWQYLLRKKMLHLLDPIKKRDYIYMDENEMLTHIKNNFSTYSDFVNHKIYQLARKRGLLTKVKELYSYF